MVMNTASNTRAVLFVGVIAGCGGGDQILTDAGPDAPPDAAVLSDNGIPTCGKSMIHVSFGGHRIENGAVDDARENESINGGLDLQPIADQPWMDAVSLELGLRLASHRIPMSRIRPADGDFTMIAFDADPVELGGDQWRFSRDCASTNPNNVVLMNGPMFVAETPDTVASAIMYAIGRTVGLDNVNATNNCQAYLLHEACNFAEAVQTTGQPCGHTQQDQVTILATAFACP
jgi:hypothetical protein